MKVEEVRCSNMNDSLQLIMHRIDNHLLENGTRPKSIVVNADDWLKALDLVYARKGKTHGDMHLKITSFDFSGVDVYCVDKNGVMLNIGEAASYVTKNDSKNDQMHSFEYEMKEMNFIIPLYDRRIAWGNMFE